MPDSDPASGSRLAEALTGSGPKGASDKPEFVSLLRALKSDPVALEQLQPILRLTGEPRMRAINIFHMTLKKEGAPPEILRAWEQMLDPNVAEAVIQTLREGEPKPRSWDQKLADIISFIVMIIILGFLFVIAWSLRKPH